MKYLDRSLQDISPDYARVRPAEFYTRAVSSLLNAAKAYKQNWQERAKLAWKIYRQEYVLEGKLPWQAKARPPRLTKAIEVAASILKRLTVENRNFFVVDVGSNDEMSKNLAKRIEAALWYVLEENKFTENFYQALITGLVTGMMAFKVYWYTESEIEYQLDALGLLPQETIKSGVRIELVDPLSLYLDWTGNDQFAIHEFLVDLAFVKQLGETGYFDPEAVKQVKGGDVTAFSQDKGLFLPQSSYKKLVKLCEFWGMLTDENGEIVHPNTYLVIADDSILLRGPIPNPYAPFKHPFIVTAPFYAPFRVYHKGLATDAIELQLEMSELLNLIIDATRYGSLPIFTVQLDMLLRPEDIVEGLRPGKVVLLQGNIPPQASPVTAINVGGATQEMLAAYNLIEREIQNATGITEFIMGTPTARGRPTATEVVTGRQQATALVEVIGRNIEDQLLEPLLQRVWLILTKYHDEVPLGELKRILLEIDELSGETEVWERPLKFRARGFSTIMMRAQEVNKITAFLSLLQAFPDAPLHIRWRNLLSKIVEAMQWQPDDILRPEEEVEAQKQQMAMQQLMQALTAMQAGGGRRRRQSRRQEERPGVMGEALGGMERTE